MVNSLCAAKRKIGFVLKRGRLKLQDPRDFIPTVKLHRHKQLSSENVPCVHLPSADRQRPGGETLLRPPHLRGPVEHDQQMDERSACVQLHVSVDRATSRRGSGLSGRGAKSDTATSETPREEISVSPAHTRDANKSQRWTLRGKKNYFTYLHSLLFISDGTKLQDIGLKERNNPTRVAKKHKTIVFLYFF